jgi:hypothetical protein
MTESVVAMPEADFGGAKPIARTDRAMLSKYRNLVGCGTTMRIAPYATAAFLSLSLLAGSGLARADEIKVMASVALKSTLDDLAAKFESTSGDKVTMVYGLAAQLKQRVSDGEADDVAVLIRPMMEARDIRWYQSFRQSIRDTEQSTRQLEAAMKAVEQGGGG